MYIIDMLDTKLAFYQGRKTGCSTVMAWGALIQHSELYENVMSGKDDPENIIKASARSGNFKQYLKLDKFAKEYNIPNHTLRFCVVRDPIKRFISAYNHMVLSERYDINVAGVDHIIDILSAQDGTIEGSDGEKAKNHFASQVSLYGKDPEKFNFIFNIKHMKDVKAFLEQQSGLKLPDLNRNPARVHLSNAGNKDSIELTHSQLAKVWKLYEEDYRIYGKWIS